MEIIERDGIVFLEGKVVNLLDEFVSSVVRCIESRTDCVVVGSYIPILFGRARGTEDVDLLVPPQTREQFHQLWDSLVSSGFYFLNSGNENEIFSMLVDGLGVRIAKELRIIPNIELKFEKTRCDAYAMREHRRVVFDHHCFRISPIELQIAYKIYLGSEKDIEDALYLWEIFGESLDTSTLRSCMELLDVSGELYGIGS